MERLTIEYEGHYVPKRMCTINVLGEADDCESCDIYCKEAYEKDFTCDSCAIQECFDRLAAYENAGITPDQLQVINEEYQKMAKELAELRQQNQWILTSEGLPEENQNVICCFAHGTVTELRYWRGMFHGIYDYSPDVILAWMPLPEPYKE